MTKPLTPDICVIGAGSGGLSVAAAAAAFGVSVVLVEKGTMGGDCLNYGCVPSKALIAAAKQADAMRSGEKFGIGQVEPEIDFKAVMQHVREVIAAIAPNDSVERFTALGVRVIKAEARFKDKRTLIAGETEIRARRFVLATGSSPHVPPIPGLDGVDYLTNETVFGLTRRPNHLIVIGGGPVGVELAQAFRRLGSQITVIEAAAALGNDDPEMVAVVMKRIRADGVTVLEHTKATRAERRGKTGIRLSIETPDGPGAVDGTHLLIATGRVANTEGLGLDKAGIAYDGKGATVGDDLRTTNRRVYAIGDVAGSLQLTHVANYHAGLVLRAMLFRLKARERRSLIPRVIFTDPELAHVGMTEADAVKRHRSIRILRWPYAENDRAQAERKTAGHVKLITDTRGKILGASIAGVNAGELIGVWTLALSKGFRLGDMASLIAPYPTMSEIGKRVAITYFAEVARRPLARRLVRFLRLFG